MKGIHEIIINCVKLTQNLILKMQHVDGNQYKQQARIKGD